MKRLKRIAGNIRLTLERELMRNLLKDTDFTLYYYYLCCSLFHGDRVIETEPEETQLMRKKLVEIAQRNLGKAGIQKTNTIELLVDLEAKAVLNNPPTYYFDAFISATKRVVSKMIQIYAKYIHKKDITAEFRLQKLVNQVIAGKEGKYRDIFIDDKEFEEILRKNWDIWLKELNKTRTDFEHRVPEVIRRVRGKIKWNSVKSLEDEPELLEEFKIFDEPYAAKVKKYEDGLFEFSNSLLEILNRNV